MATLHNVRQRNKVRTRGFTLVELLVAITVLITAVGAPLFIAARGIELAIFAENRITAIQIAQEGLDYIESIRNENIRRIVKGFSPAPSWDEGFGPGTVDCTAAGNGCIVDVFNETIEQCASSPCPNLEYLDDGDERLYGHDEPGGVIEDYPNVSGFRRTVFVESISPEQLEVSVTVEWTDKTSPKSITTKRSFYSWGL